MSQMTFHEHKCDLFVAGGGLAGVCCALAAARNGVRVILCHDRPVFGGNASSEIRMHVSGANAFGSFERSCPLKTEAREGGILEEIRLRNAFENPQRSPSIFDLILYDLCHCEKNLTFFLNTSVCEVEREGDRIIAARADRQSTQDTFRFLADLFVDCTGDGRLAFEAGAEFREGREEKALFQESLAVVEPDKKRLCSTLLIQAIWMPQKIPFRPPSWARPFDHQDLKLRLYATPGEETTSLGYGYWWVEYGGEIDTIFDNEAIRDQLLSYAMGIWDHIKNGNAFPREKTDHWALSWIGFLPGKRESRRFVGLTTLTQNDLLQSRKFNDAIAYGGWPLDIHPPEGLSAPDLSPCNQLSLPYVYDIPLAAVVSKTVENLFFAGRNISATHVGFSSTRVMGTCAALGQGVGTVAAVAIQHDRNAWQIAAEPNLIHQAQQLLLRDDACLIGIGNEDEKDVARQAHVTASSEQAEGRGINIIDGFTRSLHGERGAPEDRVAPGTHRWMSDPNEGFPCRIELHWTRPVVPKKILLIFDTGMHRPLTLTYHDQYVKKMQWGRAQEETIADYQLCGHDGKKDFILADVRDNYARRRVHDIAQPVPITSLSLTVFRTWGLDHARLFEIRVWEDEDSSLQESSHPENSARSQQEK